MQPRQVINLFHVLFVAPLLYYISLIRGNAGVNFYHFLTIIGFGVIFYHLYRLSQRGLNLVNLLHVLVVGPFLIHLGLSQGTCNPECFRIAFWLSLGVLTFHMSRFIRII